MMTELTSLASRLRHCIEAFSGDFESSRTPEGCPDPAGSDAASGHSFDFNEFALELFRVQFALNPVLRRLGDARGVKPDAVRDWKEIPAVPTAAFKELDVSCLPSEQRTGVFHSSGTTGRQPSRHFHSTESLAVYELSLWTWFRAHLLKGNADADLELVVLTPPRSVAPDSSLVHMFDTIRKRLGFGEKVFVGRVASDGSWEVDFDAALERLRGAVRDGRPVMMPGTAFSFVHLLDHLSRAGLGLTLPRGSRVMETGGYKGRSRVVPKRELHRLITSRLGVAPESIVCEYGMSELSSQAYDRAMSSEGARRFRFPPWTRVRVISPETGSEAAEGETGLLQVFDLANLFSAMAIQTEDLAVRMGDGFELLGRARDAEPRGCSLASMDEIKR